MLPVYNFLENEYLVSTDKLKLQIDVVHQFLTTESYWAKDIPLATVERSIENSLCFGLYHREKQIGYARVITDYATFAYLADVFIIKGYRGRGLSKWMMEIIADLPELQNMRRWSLATRDAHSLYSKIGFTPLSKPDIWMEKYVPDFYSKNKL